MLRFLYTICDLLSGLFAVLSPVAILHWLAKATNMAPAAPFIAMLDPFFAPLDATLELIAKPPPIIFNGQTITTTQGALAILLTLGFFLLHFCSEWLKATEQKIDVTKQAMQQRIRLQQLKSEETKRQVRSTSNKRVFMFVAYDFPACPHGGSVFESAAPRCSVKILQSLPDSIMLEASNLEIAIRYCLETTQTILSYYATLRPADPQPPFRVAIYPLETTATDQEIFTYGRKLSHYAGPNQLLFSQDTRTMLETQGLGLSYHYQSLGMYMVNNENQELYRLFFQKRQSGFS